MTDPSATRLRRFTRCVCRLACLLVGIGGPMALAADLTPGTSSMTARICVCPGCTDLTADGTVDICDDLLFLSDLETGNLRSDFNEDGQINLTDGNLFYGCYTSSPAPAGTTGSGTIGVYFDAAGTMTELHDVAIGAPVSIYIVAHDMPAVSLRALTFALDLGDQVDALTEVLPAPLETSYNLSEHFQLQFARGRPDLCMPADGTVVLMQYTFPYLPLGSGPVNTIIGIRGLDGVQTPWPLPGYLPCGTSCDVTYIPLAPATNGRAIINPYDYNGNGLADSFEVAGTRWYHISGESTGVPWMTSVRKTGGTDWHDEVACGPLAPGSSAAAVAAELVARIDAIAGDGPGPEAGFTGWGDSSFWVSAPGGTEFELGVGASAAAYPGDYCWSPPSPFCAFNPTLTEIMEPTSSVPAAGGFQLNNHPNPFNPGTTITFELPVAARVDLTVFDVRGQLVRTLIEGQQSNAGYREVAWDGRDERGSRVAAGVYLYRLQAGPFSEARSMIMVK